MTVPDAGYYFNYPTYQLAVEMLMDDSGLGMTNQDVRNLYVDMAAGATFEAAFDAHAPVDLATYESEFYDLAEVYLPEHRSWPTSPTGLVAVAVAIAGAMVGLMRLGYSRSVATDTAEPGRAVSITHRAMTVAMAGVAIVFYVAILSILGNAHELNNEMEASVRLLAYVIVNVFLVLAAGLVYLSMRHWRRPTRRSLLIAPSILVLAVVTFLVLAVVV